MAQGFAGAGERASDGVKSVSACRAKRPDLLLGNLNLLVVRLDLADYRPSTDNTLLRKIRKVFPRKNFARLANESVGRCRILMGPDRRSPIGGDRSGKNGRIQ